GDAARGRAIVINRRVGLCLLCHNRPFPEEKLQGNLAPDLAGTGARWSAGQLRLRTVDARRPNPETIMPPYYRIDGLDRVAPAFRNRAISAAQKLEDGVAFLATLKDKTRGDRGPTESSARRHFLAAAGAVALAPIFVRPARATPDTMAAAIREVVGE